MALSVHFTDEDWRRLERDWAAWWAGDLERPLVVMECLDPALEAGLPPVQKFVSCYGLDTPVDEVLDRYEARLEATRWWGDGFPKWRPNFGPLAVAAFLGARVNAVEETTWFDPPEVGDIRGLRLDFDAENAWQQRVFGMMRRAVERWRGRVCVSFTSMGDNLDILAALRTTEQTLLDLYDAPEEVERLLDEVNRLWLRYFDEQWEIVRAGGRGSTPWAPIWSSGPCGMLQSDFAYMISPRMFERFVLPQIAGGCDAIGHNFYHLDGKGQIPHLDMLLSIESLRGVQWIPGDGAPPPEEWLPLLKRIRDGGKLCQVFVSAAGALRIVRELGGKGFVLAVSDQMPEGEAREFLKALRTEDKGLMKRLR